MKRLDFDLAVGAMAGAGQSELRAATRVMQRHRDLLAAPGVVGIWVGAKALEPYIMVAVHEEAAPRLSEAIPDSLEGFKVYYMEGQPDR